MTANAPAGLPPPLWHQINQLFSIGKISTMKTSTFFPKGFFFYRPWSILLLLALPVTGFAATYSWLGTVNNNWAQSGNWSQSGVPGVNDDVVIGIGGTPQINSTVSVKIARLEGMG